MKTQQNAQTITTVGCSKKPIRPASDECCGGGSCCPCVWDEYKEKLKVWRLQNADNNDNE
ncbi:MULTISPECIES: oxidoreductase-like domain-containing protein [Pseudoalteromonas]|uniref:Oxidoreductase-like domain-containing protein n=1 Tax=Pseudoalteromonas haloplanktis TaxID=228 RepID=A0ABU1BAY3_PSEHA|nr:MULTISPECIES: oxidoreductase-like domain-containing protein [Pseudoalteromonas]MDQ9091688.1 oxidoreductase-like domain-containing protein [Pseudoalteromonas haloplanktis]TMN73210.1 oxidoreductase [Pseudoalteromonas sp. S1727]